MSTRSFGDCCDTVITRGDQLVVAAVIPVVLEDPAWSGDIRIQYPTTDLCDGCRQHLLQAVALKLNGMCQKGGGIRREISNHLVDACDILTYHRTRASVLAFPLGKSA